MRTTRRAFLAAIPAPVLAASAVGASIVSSPHPIAEAARHFEAEKANRSRVCRELSAFSRAHPGPREGGTMENFALVAAMEDGPLMEATARYCGAIRRLDGLIRSAGYRAAIVGGRLYVALSDEEHQEEDHLGIAVGGILNLDG